MTDTPLSAPRWLCAGREIFPALLAALATARTSIQLETYIYAEGRLGRQVLAELAGAARRGVRVRVLVDAVGSWFLPDRFFDALLAAGGEVRRFNPLHRWRFGVRDHRKLLICDDRLVVVGGFNLADEYDGDGLSRGWFDLGLRLEDPRLARELAESFAELFALADFHRKPMLRLRPFRRKRPSEPRGAGRLLTTHPGRGASRFQTALSRDLATAREVRIISAYFLPTRRVRRDLLRVVRRGGRVQLLLAGRSDVPVSQMAARSLYLRLLRAGVEIYEYQPQILHAKLILVDDVVYVGSSNLDLRSLTLNYELMLRLTDPVVTAGAAALFAGALQHSRKIERATCKKSQTFWQRTQNHWAHFLLARIDPWVALSQFRSLRS
jgi:cardiolipin synthase A/B